MAWANASETRGSATRDNDHHTTPSDGRYYLQQHHHPDVLDDHSGLPREMPTTCVGLLRTTAAALLASAKIMTPRSPAIAPRRLFIRTETTR